MVRENEEEEEVDDDEDEGNPREGLGNAIIISASKRLQSHSAFFDSALSKSRG